MAHLSKDLQGNVLFPATTGLIQEKTADWTWPWTLKDLHLHRTALLAPWEKGLECDLLVTPSVTSERPFWVHGTWLSPAGGTQVLKGTFVYVFPSVGTHRACGGTGPSYTSIISPPREATTGVLFQDSKLAHILQDGRDLPVLVPVTALSFHP